MFNDWVKQRSSQSAYVIKWAAKKCSIKENYSYKMGSKKKKDEKRCSSYMGMDALLRAIAIAFGGGGEAFVVLCEIFALRRVEGLS